MFQDGLIFKVQQTVIPRSTEDSAVHSTSVDSQF